jgi:hypothetical protein
MIATLQPSPLDHWRQRIGGSRRRSRRPRPLAALGYLANGPAIEGLIEVEKLTLVILYDAPTGHGQHAVRLAGFSGVRVPWGVKWGGAEQCRFLKNLLLQPVPNGPGLRLNTASTDLLRLGLQMDRDLERHVRHPSLPVRQQLRLPCLWAGFKPADVSAITGDGPELEAYSSRTGKSAKRLLQGIRREYFGLSLYPFPWVSHHWQQAVAVFADLERFPRRQVFSLRHPPGDLIGFQNAAEFDFFHDRFHPVARRRPRRQKRPVLVPA